LENLSFLYYLLASGLSKFACATDILGQLTIAMLMQVFIERKDV